MNRKAWAHQRESRQARGYGARWGALRLLVLKRDFYLCQCATCKARGAIKPATEVDHIVSKARWLRQHGSLEGVDELSNLQAINSVCHSIKTIEERGHKVALRVGDDGYPIDDATLSDAEPCQKLSP